MGQGWARQCGLWLFCGLPTVSRSASPELLRLIKAQNRSAAGRFNKLSTALKTIVDIWDIRQDLEQRLNDQIEQLPGCTSA